MVRNIDWANVKAGIYKSYIGGIKPVSDVDFVDINSLVGLERQKSELVQNTQNFIDEKGFNNALLWGERGCGKSSLVKAVFTKFASKNLRLIEIVVKDLSALDMVLDMVRESKNYKFIIFCDDLSFSLGESEYKFLKPILEGSIEKPPKNAVLYATSNRRHIVAEKPNEKSLHAKDESDEILSLSDRFGLWISFYQGKFDEYLDIVNSYFSGFKGDKELLHARARQYANLRGSRSGRVARQFFEKYKDEFLEN